MNSVSGSSRPNSAPSLSREECHDSLIRNARQVSIDNLPQVKNWPGLVKPKLAGAEVALPGFVPFIGSEYGAPSTAGRRTLAYALSQNLHSDDDHALKWAKDWQEDGLLALDRQNQEFEGFGRIAMRPFDTGHLPVLCAILRHLVSNRRLKELSSIYLEVAATNLSKFSFRSDDAKRTVDSKPSLQHCWEWFSLQELESLQPDFLLCAGKDVSRIVQKGLAGLAQTGGSVPVVLEVAFPNRQVINRRYRKPDRLLAARADEILTWITEEDCGRKVEGGRLAEIVRRDEQYFASMFDWIRKQLKTAGVPVQGA